MELGKILEISGMNNNDNKKEWNKDDGSVNGARNSRRSRRLARDFTLIQFLLIRFFFLVTFSRRLLFALLLTPGRFPESGTGSGLAVPWSFITCR